MTDSPGSAPGASRPDRITRPYLVLAVLALWVVSAGPAGAVELVKSAFSGGAVAASDASYSLVATIGEAGVVGRTAGPTYSLSQGFWGGVRSAATGVLDALGPVVFTNGLLQNAPNPFRADTAISFSVSSAAATRLDVYDVSGRRVRTLVNDVRQPGRHRVNWDGRDGSRSFVGSGVYFYRLSIGGWSDTRKMLRLN